MMRRSASILGVLAGAALGYGGRCGGSSESGSDPNSSTGASEAAAEQAIEQSISTYSEASGSITTSSGSVTFACAKGGTGSYDQTEEAGGKVCWTSTLSGCTFVNNNGGTLSMSGSTKMCASAVPADDDLETLAESGTMDFSGTYTVSGTVGNVSIPARSCSYAYTATMSYYAKDTFDCAKTTLTGSIECGITDSRDDTNWVVDVCVEAEVTIE